VTTAFLLPLREKVSAKQTDGGVAPTRDPTLVEFGSFERDRARAPSLSGLVGGDGSGGDSNTEFEEEEEDTEKTTRREAREG
jgi:hypothetical protein